MVTDDREMPHDQATWEFLHFYSSLSFPIQLTSGEGTQHWFLWSRIVSLCV